jgi:signal transduction histidine kinase
MPPFIPEMRPLRNGSASRPTALRPAPRGARGTHLLLTLRAKLSLVLSVLLVLSIGLTGGILIYESAKEAREHVTREHELLAENRAFALRDNLQILEGELDRLTLLPQVDLTDENPAPEAELLEAAHRHSVLYNTAVLLVSADGTCIGAVPDRPEFRSRRFADAPWFQAAKRASPNVHLAVIDDPSAGRVVNIVQPIVRKRAFLGAAIGVVALDQSNIIIPTLRENLPDATDALLIDRTGHVIYPTNSGSLASEPGWSSVIEAAAKQSKPGTRSATASGQDSLFAFAPVEAGTDFIVVFRRPWSVLVSHLHRQAQVLGGILIFGVVAAGAAGLWLSAYLTKPLEQLRASAVRLTMGQRGPETELGPLGGGDELAALVHDFLEMERAIGERDRALREAANLLERRVVERTTELATTQKALVEAERFAAMGKTSAAIAHELKNSLNGLGMAVELIVETSGNQARGTRLRSQVLAEVNRLRDIVDSLSLLSRTPRIERRRENLSAVIERAVDLLGDLIADRSAAVELDVPPGLEFACDGHKIQGVVMNLIKNAVEAGRNVRVRARVDPAEAVVEVSDDGPGISEEARRHLFEPFFTTKPNGTGLGLPTSLRYVQAHGGRLEASRAPDLGGALLKIRLPRGIA